jgi:COX assembly mitochondrial protein 2
MHPPLYQPHPLCRAEVDALVACHDGNPVMKFFNACGDAKAALDLCFREEKKLRRKLNPRVSEPGAVAVRAAIERRMAAAGGAGGGDGGTPPAPPAGAGGS